jgi:NDP-sugar pyrophosphorylase family protein
VLQVDKSIIGWDSTIGAWSRLENHCVLGEDVQVKVSALAALAVATDVTAMACLLSPLMCWTPMSERAN